MQTPVTLYTYWRSSAAYRVRIALNLKGLQWQPVAVNLALDGGEHRSPVYRALNAQALVPTLQYGERTLTQSLAIMEFLEEQHPEPALLPDDPVARCRVRAQSLAIACEMHPLNNLRVLRYLKENCAMDAAAVGRWYAHWIAEGFTALETELAGSGYSGRFSHGDSPSMLDCCLVPQIYNALRFDCDMSPYPHLLRINAACLELEAFRRAEPAAQADAV